MTLEVMPTANAVNNGDGQGDDDDDDECWKYVGIDVESTDSDALGGSSDNEEDAVPEKRSIAGRISLSETSSLLLQSLSKRGRGSSIKKIGNCDAAPKSPIPRIQDYPQCEVVMQNFDIQATGDQSGLDPNMYWWVPQQNNEDFKKACVIATLTKKGRRNPADESPLKHNFPLPYDQSEHAKTLSVDHIFEASTLGDFFNSVLKKSDDPRCKTFVEMFDKPDGGLQAGLKSRFYSLWSQQSNPLPGNWALAGVDLRINYFKGVLLNPDLSGYPKPKDIRGVHADKNFDNLFQTWNNAGLSIDFINHPNVAIYFATRNAAVYAAFRDFDEIQKCEKDPNDKTPSTSWAEEFKNYMTNLLKANQDAIQRNIGDLMARITAQAARLKNPVTGEDNQYGRAYLALSATYPVHHFVYKTDALLRFDKASIGIRDVTLTDVCVKPVPSAACVERTIVNCIYEYKDRPELPIGECPPIPIFPASCGAGPTGTPTPTPTQTPAPSTPSPTLGTQGCYAKESREDIHGSVVSGNADDICNKLWNKGGKVTMDANSNALTLNPVMWPSTKTRRWYGVGWIKGCQTTLAKQSVGDPLGDGNKDHACPKLLFNCWANCNNGGTGGWIDVGCLRYTFKGSFDGLTTEWADVVKIG